MTFRRLPDSVASLYSELLRHAVRPTPDGSNLSFKSKRIGERDYWYLYVSVGRRRTEHYLGPETPELLATLERERALWRETGDDRAQRARLVSMLITGGATPTRGDEGTVLRLLERGGVFLAGGVIVGTIAFRAHANLLGVVWSSDTQTRDVDLADDRAFAVAVETARDVSLPELLEASGMGFLPVPSLDRRAPVTEYRLRGRELSVELLTPLVGKPDGAPRFIRHLNAWADPVRFVDYLLEDVQIAVLLQGHGILVNVPAPGRYALHKLVVAQRRPSAFAEKARRDLAQASMLLDVLVADRPGDLLAAAEAAAAIGGRFLQQMKAGLKRLDPVLLERIRACGVPF